MSSKYREFLLDLANEITFKELTIMKFLCADILRDMKADDNHGEVLFEVLGFFQELEKQNILSVNNLERLRYLLEKAKRNDLVLKVEDFQLRNYEKTSELLECASSSIQPESKYFQDQSNESGEKGMCSSPIMIEENCKNEKVNRKKRKKARYKQKKKAKKRSAVDSVTESPNLTDDNSEKVATEDKVTEKRKDISRKMYKDEDISEPSLTMNEKEVKTQTNSGVLTKSSPFPSSTDLDDFTYPEPLPNNDKDEIVIKELSQAKENDMVGDYMRSAKSDETEKGIATENKESEVDLSMAKKREGKVKGLPKEMKEEMVTEGLPKEIRKEMVTEGLPKEIRKEMVTEGLPKEKKGEMVPNSLPKGKKGGMVTEGLPKELKEETVTEVLSKEINEGMVTEGLPKEKRKEMVTKSLPKKIKEGMVTEGLTKEVKKDLVREGLPKEKKDEMTTKDIPTLEKNELQSQKKDGKVGEKALVVAANSRKPTLNKGSLGKNSIQLRRILSLCSKWQSWGESIPVLNRELCLALARAGHRVVCLVLTSSDFDREEARNGNVELIQCSDRPGIKSDDPQLFYHDQPIPFHPDLVIGHGKLTGPPAMFYANKTKPCPRLHVIHDLPNECFGFDDAVNQECDEEKLAKSADIVAVVGTLLRDKWSMLINRDVIEIVPGLPDLITRNCVSSPQCRCFVPAKFCSPIASGLKVAVMAVNNSSKRGKKGLKATLIVCNTDTSSSPKSPKVLREYDKEVVDLKERKDIKPKDAHTEIQGVTVFLSPARFEAFGVAALDAIAIGIPIVISDKSGLACTLLKHFDEKFHSCIREISCDLEGDDEVDGHNWAIPIDKIAVNNSEAFKLANELRSEWKKKFTWDAVVQELMCALTKSGKLPSESSTHFFNTVVSRGASSSCINVVKELKLFDKWKKFVLFISPEDPRLMHNTVYLGLVHWAAVFDFDRDSTTTGYLKSCETFLERNGKPACRMMPPPKEDENNENLNLTLPNGIPWILLQGQPDMKRDIDGNLDWIQEIFNHLKKKHPSIFTILVIWNTKSDNNSLCKKLSKILTVVQASSWKNSVELKVLATSNLTDDCLYDIAKEWNVKIRTIDIPQFCSAIHSSAVANPLYQFDPEFSLPKRNTDSDDPHDVSSTTIPSSMRWVNSVLEVLFGSTGMTPEFGQEDAYHFYRGGKISWYGIEMKYAVKRESWEPLRKRIEKEMKYSGAAFLTLFHQRGTGGTTSARKLLYDLHLQYPCVCLKTINHETFLAIKLIWEFCLLPVIVLADIKEGPGADAIDIESLYGSLSNEKVSCLILHVVHRHYQENHNFDRKLSNNETAVLAKPLTEEERDDFVKVYCFHSPERVSEINKMRHEDDKLQIPFYYGLAAFEDRFKGLEPFVSDCLRELKDAQRKALCFLSIAFQYAQRELPLSALAGIFNLKPRQLHSIEDILTEDSIQLLIEEEGCWRPRHFTIGKEVLRQLLTVPFGIHKDNWKSHLADKAIEFVTYMEEDVTKAVLLNRISDEKTFKQFSSLVEDIPESKDVVKIFKKAINCYPQNPFLQAHLGRYYSVQKGKEGFEIALRYTDDSIILASKMSKNVRSQLTQMRGIIFKRQVKYEIESGTDLEKIIPLAEEAMKSFTHAASINPDKIEDAYIPQVRMMCDIFKYVDRTFKGGFFKYLESPSTHPFILDGVSETSDVLESVSDSIYYPDLRRDLFRLGLKRDRNKPENKADLLKHYQDLKKKAKTSTASINRNIVLIQLEICNEERGKLVSRFAKGLIDLLEEALKYDNNIDLTMRLWVRVAPHIPVDLQTAESKIASWCNKGKSVMSYLYRYIITCIRILGGSRDQRFEDERINARDELHKSVHDTSRNRLKQPDRPVVFLGNGKGMGQFVTLERESVKEVRKQRTISESDTRQLRRLTGIITKTGKVGEIKVDGLTVSFRADLCQPPLFGGSNLAKKVCFYLAFNYFETDAYNVKIVAE